jgi:hypothetical protein
MGAGQVLLLLMDPLEWLSLFVLFTWVRKERVT